MSKKKEVKTENKRHKSLPNNLFLHGTCCTLGHQKNAKLVVINLFQSEMMNKVTYEKKKNHSIKFTLFQSYILQFYNNIREHKKKNINHKGKFLKILNYESIKT